MAELNAKTFAVLWRQDWFVVERFKGMAGSPHHFSDPARFKELIDLGSGYIQSDNIESLRQVVAHLAQMQIDTGSDTDMLAIAAAARPVDPPGDAGALSLTRHRSNTPSST